MQGTDIKEELDNRLQEIIDSHVNSLGAEFRRLIGELPLQVESAEDAGGQAQAVAMGHLKTSVEAIHAAGNQREMAYRILDATGRQAARSALFLVRNETCVGFETRGFNDAPVAFDQVVVTPESEDPLHAALNQQETMHLHGSSLAGSALSAWLDDAQPQQVCLAPVVVGGQTVAVLYADSGVNAEAGAIYPESVEILASVAGMFLERMRRPAAAPGAPADHVATVSMPSIDADDQPADERPDDGGPAAVPLSDDSHAVDMDSAPLDMDSPPLDMDAVPTGDSAGLAAAPATGDEPLATDPALSMAPEAPAAELNAEDDPAATRVLMGDEMPPATFDPTATVALSDFDEPEAIPAATDMEAGAVESATEAPQESQQEEDARRFARLLVSEVVLYNEAQVKAGQKNADLLSRLKEPISRSRDAYEERFGTETLNYFDEELVRTLAGGEARLLGVTKD